MLRLKLRRALAALALALAVLAPPPAHADTEVDLALVIAVDISYSMDVDELALQRQGFADAFRSPQVHDAIRRGTVGRIAVVYFEWAGSWDQRVIVPWSVIDGPESAGVFADKVSAQPVRRAQRTSISGAIDFAMKLLGQSGVDATRRVVDISGDGPNNQGRPVTIARAEALAQGVTINGLPIMQFVRGVSWAGRTSGCGGVSPATSRRILVLMAAGNCSRSRAGTTKAPWPPMTQSR